ncbi:MAG: winged helix-turn-helix transcriptional regulator [Candidatus Bathyarchaeota archaeon]|nr:winged helix-turn-helix transcriptional regulator [Candidatus Bathyarchaeota archaeon]
MLGTVASVYAQDYSSDSLAVRVYSDGSVDVEYVIEPDTTLAQVNVSLVGELYQDVIVVDQDGIILDWVINPDGIEVDSLGSTAITITYTTDSLTDKTGSQWSVEVTTDINLVYTLPKGAVLTGLNPAPTGISVIDSQATITMPAGTSSIAYMIGTTGTQEHALVLLNTAKSDVNNAVDNGLIVNEAEAILAQAIQAYQNEQYIQSEQYSTQTSESVAETEIQAAAALNPINEAGAIIESRRNQIDDAIIDEAEALLELAQNQYDEGLYAEARDNAIEAYDLVIDAPIAQGGNQTLLIAGVVIVVLIGAGYWYMSQKGKKQVQRPDTVQPKVDLDLVFSRHPNLRTDDKAVLRYLEETGGVFVTEVREHFDIPKSSAWRMVRRLEEEGIISTSMVGGETYLQLKAEEDEQ